MCIQQPDIALMIDLKIYLITGIGGARHGFVAGWLGTLPNFIDNQWYIDIETGHTNGYMSILKDLDQGMLFTDFLKNKDFCLSPTAQKYFAGQCHGHFLKKSVSQLDTKCVTVIKIDTSNVDPNHIAWEFLVKTYLRKNRAKNNYEDDTYWNIDKKINKPYNLITDQDRIKQFTVLATTFKLPTAEQFEVPGIDILLLDYTKLFCIDGSQYLCDQLDFTVINYLYHQYWNYMLKLAKSPDSINVWGVDWNKSDFFN